MLEKDKAYKRAWHFTWFYYCEHRFNSQKLAGDL